MRRAVALVVAVVLVSAVAGQVQRPKKWKPGTKGYYLGLPSDKLWNILLAGRKIGSCYLIDSRRDKDEECDLYFAAKDSRWPLNPAGKGRGCVRAPDFPKNITMCPCRGGKCANVDKYDEDRFCTHSAKNNVVAILRHAIENDRCGLLEDPSGQPTCSYRFRSKEYYMRLDDEQLWKLAKSHNLNSCYIIDRSRTPDSRCDLYVAAAGKRWPLNDKGKGLGCVKAPDFPKKVTRCPCKGGMCAGVSPQDEKSFCTSSGKANAVAVIRHAIENNKCGLNNHVNSEQLISLLKLDDWSLFYRATNGNAIGKCYIQTATAKDRKCDLFARISTGKGSRAFPQSEDGGGDGCIKAPDYPKKVKTCKYFDPKFGLDLPTASSLCTNQGQRNAANHLRLAIREGLCCQ
mmetsp:Transcript_12522/g.38246  ORF Transcript_12522/g.38246 Transcript_12522/m.38246 type:complete len:402 (-) Transcript_12522:94-1299(-)